MKTYRASHCGQRSRRQESFSSLGALPIAAFDEQTGKFAASELIRERQENGEKSTVKRGDQEDEVQKVNADGITFPVS